MKFKVILILLVMGSLPVYFAFIQSTVWIAPSESKKLKNQIQNIPVAIKEGGLLFKKLCVVCHGETGKGDGAMSMSIQPRPENLQLPKVAKQTDGEIYWKITTGKSPMPSYKESLTEQQRWQLVCYLRKLENKE